jgi:hypothetical protein
MMTTRALNPLELARLHPSAWPRNACIACLLVHLNFRGE